MGEPQHSETRSHADARKWVRHAQRRVDRSHGLSDDTQQRAQERLNEVRHLLEQEDDAAASDKIDALAPWLDDQLDGKEKSVVREYAESIGLAVLFALMLRGFVIEAFKIPTGSMIPTLLVGDHLFVNKFIYGIRVPFTETWVTHFEDPARGEVIVFKFPRQEAKKYLAKQPASRRKCIDTSSLQDEKDFIKRIIGVEGDTVELRDNQLIVNGEPLDRTFIEQKTTGQYLYEYQFSEREHLNGHTYTIQYSGADENFGPIKVKKDHVFVMGDNRDKSSDGRCWGQVPVENIKGRAMVVWFSIGPDSYRWDRIGHVIH